MLYRLVANGEFAQVMADHLRLHKNRNVRLRTCTCLQEIGRCAAPPNSEIFVDTY